MSGTNESAAEPDSTNVTAASEQEKSTDALEKKEDCVTEPEKPENKCENEKATPMPSVADENEATGSTDKQHEPEQTPPQKECNEEKTGDVKTEEKPSVDQEKASPLQEKIIRQMEFYFGDRNFPKDKFLQQAVESSNDGWIPLTTLLTFNRLKTLSSDAELIASALRKATADIVQVSEDGKSVRRHPDKTVPDVFAADFRKDMMGRSIYAKGFPEDTQLDQLQEFMDQFGKVHCIQMRRIPGDKDKKFKGSIFAEFVQVEDAEKFVKSEKIQFNGKDLLIEWKGDYFKRKQEERKLKKETKKNVDQECDEEKGPVSVVKVSGCVVHFTGLSGDKSREDIREDLLPFGTVAFVDFDRGKTEGYVRFREEGGAKRAREGLLDRAVGGTGVAQLCGCNVELKVLEGEEEEQYWHKVIDGGTSGRDKRGGRRGGRGGGRGRGGRGGGNFRKRRERSSGGRDDDSKPPHSKAAKTED